MLRWNRCGAATSGQRPTDVPLVRELGLSAPRVADLSRLFVGMFFFYIFLLFVRELRRTICTPSPLQPGELMLCCVCHGYVKESSGEKKNT